MRHIVEQISEWQATLYLNFIDFEKAFDFIRRESQWAIMKNMANNEGHEGAESLQTAVNYFFYLAKCYRPIVAMEICRRTALKKKMASTSERKVGCVCFQFCSHSHSFKEKKAKETGDETEGKTKWRMF